MIYYFLTSYSCCGVSRVESRDVFRLLDSPIQVVCFSGYNAVSTTANQCAYGSYPLLSVEESDDNKRVRPVVYKSNK